MKTLATTLLLLVAATLAQAQNAEARFSTIAAIPGVNKIVHEAPFLWIVCQKSADFDAIDQAVANIVRSGIEPDVVALDGRFNLTIVDEPSFTKQLAIYNSIKRATTAKGLSELFSDCQSAYLYDLDWDSPQILVSRKILRRGLPSELPREMETLERIIAATKNNESRPEKFLCIKTDLPLGALVYPIYGDELRIRKIAVSYQAFLEQIQGKIAPKTWAADPEPIAAESPAL